ncbi:DUF6115 domain-containing protein [Caloramator sp. ALD01]|uniref:DUF6115 domain-containing protein n=1 Tax=Caloramator sp. ALD01 TaxID=1031288 RepID=UPI00042A6F84|nr:hypothetical protein [Caloramator sp. ALD01]
MPLVLIILGASLIYYSYRLGIKAHYSKNIQNNKNVFKNYYTKSELDLYKKDINELKENINYINESIFALNLKIEDIQSNYNNILSSLNNKEKIGINDTYQNFEDKSENLNDKIKELYNKGLSIEEISSTLRIGKGEVLLRLGLNK